MSTFRKPFWAHRCDGFWIYDRRQGWVCWPGWVAQLCAHERWAR